MPVWRGGCSSGGRRRTDLDIGRSSAIDGDLSRANQPAIWDQGPPAQRRRVSLRPYSDPSRTDQGAHRSVAIITRRHREIRAGASKSQPFLELIRQFRREPGPENVLYIHVTLVPFIPNAGELKTKPTQHSVNELRRIGIHPDVLVCRSTEPLTKDIRDKIALFADVDAEAVISAIDVPDIYLVPKAMQKEGLDRLVCEKLGLDTPDAISASGRPREAPGRAPRGGRDRSRRQEHGSTTPTSPSAGARARRHPLGLRRHAFAGWTPA
jgi:hypothetical protein